MMNVLVTGATGYLGSALVKFLDEYTDHAIYALCRELPKHFQEWNDKYEILEGDITDRESLNDERIRSIDTILHLAAFNEIDTEDDPREALLVNGLGTRNLLAVAEENNCNNLIYFSTQKVYGRNLEGVFTVNSPTKCHDDYSVTHYIAEKYCEMYANSTQINTSIVRISNVFGAPVHREIDRWTIVPHCFCLSAVNNSEIRLRSSGKQTRDFISTDFFCESVLRLLESAGDKHSVFNVTSETNTSILDVARIVQIEAEDLLGEEIELTRESNEPKSSNRFLVRNNLTNPPSTAQVEEHLRREIRSTISLLINSG